MANFNASYIYQLKDRYSATLGRISRRTDGFKRSVAGVKDKLREMNEGLRKTGRRMRDFGNSLSVIGAGLTAALTAPIGLLATMSVQAAASLETMETSFRSMLGGAEAAREMVKRLTDFTATTPFQLEGVGAAAKQLLAFRVPSELIVDRLRMLGDVASGAGVPLFDMAAIFGKIKAKGKAMTEELLQLAERGVPIIDILAEQMGVAKDKVFELASKSKISFDTMVKAMTKMTAAGGQFFGQTKQQSETLNGLFSTLKDNLFLVRVEIGQQIVETFGLREGMKSLIEVVNKGVMAFRAFREANPELAKLITIAVAALALLGPLVITVGLLTTGFGLVASGIAAFGAAIAAAALPVTLIAGTIIFLIAAFRSWLATNHPIIGTLKEIGSMIGEIVKSFFDIFGFDFDGLGLDFSGAFNLLGDAIMVTLKPLKILLRTLTTIVGTVRELSEGNFTAAFGELTRGGSAILHELSFGTLGTDPAETVARQRAGNGQEPVQIEGNITVRGTEGSTVEKASIGLPTGANLAEAR